MVKGLVNDIAVDMGIKLTRISLVDGKRLGYQDSHLLQMYVKDCLASALVHQYEIELLDENDHCASLEKKIRSSLECFEIALEP